MLPQGGATYPLYRPPGRLPSHSQGPANLVPRHASGPLLCDLGPNPAFETHTALRQLN